MFILLNTDETEELVRNYFHQGMQDKEILKLLHSKGISISFSKLRRILRRMCLKRNTGLDNLEEATKAVQYEVQGSGSCLGYRSMQKRLLNVYGISIAR